MLKAFTAISSGLPGCVGEAQKSGNFTLCVTRSNFSIVAHAGARLMLHEVVAMLPLCLTHRMCTPSCRRNRVLFRPPTCRHDSWHRADQIRHATVDGESDLLEVMSSLRWRFFTKISSPYAMDKFA